MRQGMAAKTASQATAIRFNLRLACSSHNPGEITAFRWINEAASTYRKMPPRRSTYQPAGCQKIRRDSIGSRAVALHLIHRHGKSVPRVITTILPRRQHDSSLWKVGVRKSVFGGAYGLSQDSKASLIRIGVYAGKRRRGTCLGKELLHLTRSNHAQWRVRPPRTDPPQQLLHKRLPTNAFSILKTNSLSMERLSRRVYSRHIPPSQGKISETHTCQTVGSPARCAPFFGILLFFHVHRIDARAA